MGETLRDEVTTVVKMLDEWAADHGDEAVLYRCRQRLREALQREDDDDAEAEALVSEGTTRRLMDHARSIMAKQDAAPPADAPEDLAGNAIQAIRAATQGRADETLMEVGAYGEERGASYPRVGELRALLAAAEKAGPGPATHEHARRLLEALLPLVYGRPSHRKMWAVAKDGGESEKTWVLVGVVKAAAKEFGLRVDL